MKLFGPSRNAGGVPGDDDDEMLRRDRLDDRTADAVLRGRGEPVHGDGFADLAAFVAAVRTEATSGSTRPNASLAEVLAQGISADKGELPVTAASNVNGPAMQVAGPPKRRTRKMLETITASFTALGLAAKAGVAGATVVVATAGAGAAGALPDTLQGSFDNVVRGVEQAEDAPETADVEVSENGEPAETETPDGGVDGSQVAEDAKEGGVDGAAVADEASDGNSTDGRDRAEDAQQNAPQLPAQADEGADEGLQRAEDGKDNADPLPDAADDASTQSDTADDRPQAPTDQPAAPDEQPETPVKPSTQGDDTEAPVETPAADGADTAPRTQGGR